MASVRNDALHKRTVEGSLNFYDNHLGCGTAADKAIASRLGGSTSTRSTQDRHEIYMRELRHDEHFLDRKGRHTAAFFGARRRKFAPDERQHIKDCLTLQDSHPRDSFQEQRRAEIQLAQVENSGSWQGFQDRTQRLYDRTMPKRYSISNQRYANEQEKLRRKVAGKTDWLARRGESATHSASCPNLHLTAPADSLTRAMRADVRKEASQRQTESAHFAPWMAYNTFTQSIDSTPEGGITRHNNHYSSGDKLTRADPFYMRPRVGDTLNSVKYDIITNERRRGFKIWAAQLRCFARKLQMLFRGFDGLLMETPGYFADYGGSFQVSEDPAYPPNLVLKQGIAQKAGTNAWVSAAEPMTLIGHRLDDIVMSVDVFLPDFTQLPEMPERPGIQAAWDGQCLSTGGAAFGTSPPLLQESCEVKLQQSFILETSSGRLLAVETSSPQQSCLTAHRCDLSSPYADPGVCMRPCSHDQLEMSNQTWEWHPDGSLRLQMHPNLCLTQGRDRQDRAHTAFVLADCGEPHALPTQRFLATGPMPIYTGLCVRLQPRARHEDPGDLLNGLPGRNGYCLRLGVDAMKHGTWRLESGGVRAKLLAQGPLVSPFKTWHRLRLAANGTVLRVKIDDQDEVVAIHEEHTIGATALISGWHEAFYDNVAMEPPSSLEPVYY
ncbi:Uncharacterized protein SCF082_LOCUS36434 [Durusdinium trenchii]|uniref:Ricin B lectin domain-containing protein n=1 Tax=Durusdinium trenchii TaxID=1381693 RepID=A0ABP0PHL0_9DINO